MIGCFPRSEPHPRYLHFELLFMAIYWCPSCKVPLTDSEWSLGKCTGCGTSFPVEASVSSAAPVSAAGPEVKTAERRESRLTWALLCLGFLMLAVLIVWQRFASVAPNNDALSSQDLDRIERKLQRLEDLVNAKNAAQAGDWTALVARLDKLDEKIAEQTATTTRQAAEAKIHREQLARIEAQLDALAQRSFAPPPPPGPLDIKVSMEGWHDAVPDNIQAVCISAASELWQHFPDRRIEPITVTNSAKGPMVLFGRGPDGERRVLLNVKGKVWAQCTYQFSHEFCHILCNYREMKSANLWFEESLCEAASLFALRRMAKTWAMKPPYSNWRSYSSALSDYADEIVRTTLSLDNLTLAAWFTKNESLLRTNGADRPRNRVVAMALLKILERDPHHWQAVGYLNQWDAKDAEQSFATYLSDWHRRVPNVHQPFVKEVARLFEMDVK